MGPPEGGLYVEDRRRVQGPVVRVFLNASQLPSSGFAINHYQFALWTQLTDDGGIASVGSFAPESSMIPIGVLTSTRPSL